MRRRKEPSVPQAFENLRSDYQAAKDTRFERKRIVPSGGAAADYHYRNESSFLNLLEKARDLDRNDTVVPQMVNRAVANTIQDGFSLSVSTGDEKVDDELEARFGEWASDGDLCDIARELPFPEIEKLVCRHPMVDGDIVALLTDTGRIQLTEGHRIRTPRNTTRNVVLGVLLNEVRERLEYWITKDEIDPQRTVSKVSDVVGYRVRDELGNRQICHVYSPTRVSQTRGVSAFAPIFSVATMFEDIQFAKLVQAQTVSCFGYFIQQESGLIQGGHQMGARTTESQSDGSTRIQEELAPGMRVVLDPGETVVPFSPAVPNAEFFEHVRLMLTLIGINLGLPLVLVTLDASMTNFSGWRGAVDQARLGFRSNQQAIARRFHVPVYKWLLRRWMDESVALRQAGERLGKSMFNHTWIFPSWAYIEPMKDASADSLRVQKGLISPRRLYLEKQRNWFDVVEETVDDVAYMVEAAVKRAEKVNRKIKEEGDKVSWRDLVPDILAAKTAKVAPAPPAPPDGQPAEGQPPPPKKKKEKTPPAERKKA